MSLRTGSLTEHTTVGHLQERFDARARALMYARLGQMAVALLVLAVPLWRRALNIPLPEAVYWYLALLAGHAASYLWVGRPHARLVVFTTLCLDLCALVYIVVASGGIKSPLMPTQLVFTMLFALLFPSPLAIIPPLLTLPVVTWFDQILGLQNLPADVLLLLWYAALNITVVYIVVYLEGREKLALGEVLRLQRDRRMQALARQRTRIAREIHDGVGAALSGISLQTEYLVGRLEPGDLRREVEELREAAAEGMDELRRAVSILRREFKLAAAIPAYATAFGSRHRIEVATDVCGVEPAMSPEVELALFRIGQEALSNVARHAGAGRIGIELEFGKDQVVLVIEDDGCGFDPASKLEGHYGLRNMNERIRRVGGVLRIDSEAGRGTRIEVRVATQVRGAEA